jgi:hypothetical protein
MVVFIADHHRQLIISEITGEHILKHQRCSEQKKIFFGIKNVKENLLSLTSLDL